MATTADRRRGQTDPFTPPLAGRLCAAIQRSRLVLRKFRQLRVNMVREQVGKHWSEEANPLEVPFNMIATYCRVMSALLVPKNPRVMLSVTDKDHKAAVAAMEDWANQEIIDTRLAKTLKRAVLDAFYLMGIVKVGLAKPGDSAMKGWNLPGGAPFAEVVDFDDFVFDIHCRDLSEASFVGHRVRVPKATVADNPNFRKERNDLSSDNDPLYNAEGDLRMSALGRTTLAGGDGEEFEEMVSLWEIYLPRHRRVVTLLDDSVVGASSDQIDVRVLRSEPYVGPQSGPYHYLAFQEVPDNALPAAPIPTVLYDLHMALNNVWRKLIRQCERTKQVTLVAGTADADGQRVMEANDGDMLRVDAPEKISQVVYGGPTQELVAVATILKDAFSWFAGNLDLIAGLGPQSKTAAQDQMLHQSASTSVGDMQDATVTFTSGVLESLMWYWWNDPRRVMETKYTLPGMPSMSMPRRLHPWASAVAPGIDPAGVSNHVRAARFRALKLQIDPYSMQHQTPQSRLTLLSNVVQQVIMPALPAYMQQGIMIDLNAFLEKYAKYGDMPDLPDIVTISAPPAPQESSGAGESAPRMPTATTRSYVRENRSERTDQASNKELVNTLFSGKAKSAVPGLNGSAK